MRFPKRHIEINEATQRITFETSADRLLTVDILREIKVQAVKPPCRVFVIPREENFAAHRTDSRPSESYMIVDAHNSGYFLLDFHEGHSPFEAPQNGFFVLALLGICADRLEVHQSGPFADKHNGASLWHVRNAQHHLNERAIERDKHGILATQTPTPKATPEDAP